MRDLTSPHNDPAQTKILVVYWVLAFSLALSLVPVLVLSIPAMLGIVCVLIAAYLLRARAQGDSLAENHMTYVIRTIWIGSGFAALTTTLAGIFLIGRMDDSMVQPCAQKLADHVLADPAAAQEATIAQLAAFLDPCLHPFIEANMGTLTISLGIAGGPVLFYTALRLARGLSRAMRGYRLAHPRAWL